MKTSGSGVPAHLGKPCNHGILGRVSEVDFDVMTNVIFFFELNINSNCILGESYLADHCLY